jgi:hypothetical protein
MAETWQINLMPTPAEIELGQWWKHVPIDADAFGGDVDALMALANERWPGQVLDVVDGEGRSYLICAVPPWYASQPG